jgi:galactitol-specific phosphotransferase system IIC component
MGDNFGPKFFKQGINGIVSLGAAVITYTVIMVLIGKFFGGGDATALILSGDIYAGALDDSNLQALTLMSCIVMVYVIQYLVGKIPDVAKEILGAFEVQEDHKLGDKVSDEALNFTKLTVNFTKDKIKAIRGK